MDYRWTTILANQRRARWSHPGVTSLPDGSVAVADPRRPGVVIVDSSDHPGRVLTPPVSEVHDMAATEGSLGTELWIVDPGFGLEVRAGRTINRPGVGHVVAVYLDGSIKMTVEAPPIPIHKRHGAPFRPTAIAVHGHELGGRGDIWIADGYGTGMLHRFDADGTHRSVITGEEGRAGPFRNPHALLITERRGEPELIIADRHNGRLQVYDLDGRYKRVIVHPRLITPSALAAHAGRLLVAELQGGIEVFDEDGRHLESILERRQERVPGWPNRSVGDRLVRPNLEPGRLNSPHGVAVGLDGSIYIAEWVLGGRVTRLVPLAGAR